MSKHVSWMFRQKLRLFAAFDLEHEDGTTHWCIRQEKMGGDSEVVAEIPDTAAMTVREAYQDENDDFDRRADLSYLLAASPKLLMVCEAVLRRLDAGVIVDSGWHGIEAIRAAVREAKGESNET